MDLKQMIEFNGYVKPLHFALFVWSVYVMHEPKHIIAEGNFG